MPFSLAEVVNDPDLGLPAVTIIRSKGVFGPGGWINTESEIKTNGVVAPATPKQLLQFPEGERIQGALVFLCTQPINSTSEDRSAVSDKIRQHGKLYRVGSLAQWGDFGFWLAIVERMQGS